MGTFIAIVLAAVLTQNFITVKTYGICPFLGVSKKTNSAIGMGIAVTLVMAIATAVTYPLYEYVMVPLGIDFLEIIFFIFIIAALVQMIEQIIKKLSPSGNMNMLSWNVPVTMRFGVFLSLSGYKVGFSILDLCCDSKEYFIAAYI